MIDFDIHLRCDNCERSVNSEGIYCEDCYDDVAKERDRLLEENDALKAELAAHGIEVQHVPRAPHLGPEVLVWKTGPRASKRTGS